MLKNTISAIPHISLLRSDKMMDALVRHIAWGEKAGGEALKDSVRDFYPNSYRLDEIEMAMERKEFADCGAGDLRYDFSFVDELFDKYLVIDGSAIYPKTETLNEYMKFLTKLSPSHIIGCKLAKTLYEGDIELADIEAFVLRSKPLGLKVDNTKEYADNHLHIKGAGYSPFNLANIANLPTNEKQYTTEYLRDQPRINEFSYINNGSYSLGQVTDILKLCVDVVYGASMDAGDECADEKLRKKCCECINNKLQKKYCDCSEEKLRKMRKDCIDEKLRKICEDCPSKKLRKIVSINRNVYTPFRYSMQKLSDMRRITNLTFSTTQASLLSMTLRYYEKKEFDKAHLAESILCFYLFLQTKDSRIKMFIRLYLHVSNILRSYMMMSQNLGLAHFSEFSEAKIRRVDEQDWENSIKGIKDSGTNYLHAKTGVSQSASEIAENVQNFYHLFEENPKKGVFGFSIGLCVNKRREDKRKTLNELSEPSFYKKRRELKKEALALDAFLRSGIHKNVSEYDIALRYTPKKAFENKRELMGQRVDISAYVSAIDAVGKETHTPPEVFAPFFRFLRKQPKKMTHAIANLGVASHHPRLIATAHAGEDFNSIVTGMRFVSECVEYFGMGNCDRIGHALSLGVSAKEWLEARQTILIYKSEHFDNVVWLCGVLKEIKAENSYLTRYILRLQEEAEKLFRELYSGVGGATMGDMYEAWEYRKNCPLTHGKQKSGATLFWEYDKAVLGEMKNKKALEIYEAYHRCKAYRDGSKQVVELDKNYFDDAAIEIYEILQDHLIDKYAKKGIIFETNPSSNVFISDMSSYERHPIFRFCPPKEKFLQKGERFNKYGIRTASALVTINSDDPAIFATSIQNEYENLLRTAISVYGCSRKEAEDWLDDIRMFGIKIFKESSYGQNSRNGV